MKKYLFLTVFAIIWAIFSPLIAFWTIQGTFFVDEIVSWDSSEPFSAEEVFFQETLSENTSDVTAKELRFSKEQIKDTILEICPTSSFEETRIITDVKYDENNECIFLKTSNSTFSASAFAEELNLSTLSFTLMETDEEIIIICNE